MSLKIPPRPSFLNAKTSAKNQPSIKKNRSLTGMAIDFLAMAIIGVGFLYLAARAPELHGSYLRASVGSRVFTIRGDENTGGGTGFAIKAPSGLTYLLTNDHVCDVSKDGENVLVQNEDGEGITRRIVARSPYTDLCLVEGVPGVKGLTVGAAPVAGQIVATVGHPKLMPITLSRGELIGAKTVDVILGLVSEKLMCDQPKHIKIPLISLLFGIEAGPDYDGPFVCAERIKGAYLTNVLIQPGSSGSPLVNFWGNLVGVAFAGDQAGWGIMVSHEDLTQFLSLY